MTTRLPPQTPQTWLSTSLSTDTLSNFTYKQITHHRLAFYDDRGMHFITYGLIPVKPTSTSHNLLVGNSLLQVEISRGNHRNNIRMRCTTSKRIEQLIVPRRSPSSRTTHKGGLYLYDAHHDFGYEDHEIHFAINGVDIMDVLSVRSPVLSLTT